MGPCQADDVSPHETPCAGNFIFASQDNGHATTARLVHDTFHDFTKATVESHFECLFILDVTSVVVEDSRFYNCMEAGIQLEYRVTPQSITIQNNWFGRTADEGGAAPECNAIRLSGNRGNPDEHAHPLQQLRPRPGSDSLVWLAHLGRADHRQHVRARP